MFRYLVLSVTLTEMEILGAFAERESAETFRQAFAMDHRGSFLVVYEVLP